MGALFGFLVALIVLSGGEAGNAVHTWWNALWGG